MGLKATPNGSPISGYGLTLRYLKKLARCGRSTTWSKWPRVKAAGIKHNPASAGPTRCTRDCSANFTRDKIKKYPRPRPANWLGRMGIWFGEVRLGLAKVVVAFEPLLKRFGDLGKFRSIGILH